MIEKRLNPFTNALVVPYIEMVLYKERDEKGDMKSIGYQIEADRYTRLYITPGKRDILFRKLSGAAFKLFWFAVYSTNPSYEYVILSYEKVNEGYQDEGDKPLSMRGYKDGLRELVSMNLIDAKDLKNNQYWVNPTYFCPGNRLKMYPGCALKVDTQMAKTKKLN